MIRAIVLDLDDTLYDEVDFFRSGFRVVAELLAQRGVGEADAIQAMLLASHLQEGREHVFNRASERLGFPASWIPLLVSEFRLHTPAIQLAEETVTLLRSLREHYLLACITDGWADVQRRKVERLGLGELMDVVVICDDHGREFWKPHELPFRTCCETLGVSPSEAIFVGDSTDRDVLGALRAGMTCVRISRPLRYPFVASESPGAPHAEIVDLRELLPVIERFRAEVDGHVAVG